MVRYYASLMRRRNVTEPIWLSKWPADTRCHENPHMLYKSGRGKVSEFYPARPEGHLDVTRTRPTEARLYFISV
jgi:hypothetical protein